jgi:hypothetical protein
MALFVFTLIWETVTSLKKGACFWEAWTDTDYPEERPDEDNTKPEDTA